MVFLASLAWPTQQETESGSGHTSGMLESDAGTPDEMGLLSIQRIRF
jgi:hypothetical protein